MTRLAMVMDQRRCIGCQSCTVACRTWNDLPMDIIYNPVVSEGVQGTFPHVHQNWTPLICMHCEKAPCVLCCPTGASQKDDDGTVWIKSEFLSKPFGFTALFIFSLYIILTLVGFFAFFFDLLFTARAFNSKGLYILVSTLAPIVVACIAA